MTIPLTIKYRRLVQVGLSANAINLSNGTALGHRVQITMPVDLLNSHFYWERPAGSPRAIGHFNSSGFVNTLITSLSGIYSDMDSIYTGLSFSSSSLDSATDPRLRNGSGESANDLVMAYVLFKCFGSTAATTLDVVYNVEDVYSMVTNSVVANAIEASLSADEAASTPTAPGYIDSMFTNLFAAQPMRFFDASGNQMPGLFEVNADISGSGSWNLMLNDAIEIPIQFTFTENVTLSSARDDAGVGAAQSTTVMIKSGDTFSVRLQILASADSGIVQPAITGVSTSFVAGQTVSTWSARGATSYSITFYQNTTTDKTTGTALDTQVVTSKNATSSTTPEEGYFYYSIVTPINDVITGTPVTSLSALYSLYWYTSTYAGTPGVQGYVDGAAASSQFNFPFDIACDSNNNVYVADLINRCIRKITPSGVVSTVAGVPGVVGYQDGSASTALFSGVTGVACDRLGNIYVCDVGNLAIRKISNGVVSTVIQGNGLNNPQRIAMNPADNNSVYISDPGNHTIFKLTLSTGALTTITGLDSPFSIQYRNGLVYVVSTSICLVFTVDPSTGATIPFASTALTGPLGLTVTTNGNVYAVSGQSIVQVLADGTTPLVSGNGAPGYADGNGAGAQFQNPYSLTSDSAGNIYVCELTNGLIRKLLNGTYSA